MSHRIADRQAPAALGTAAGQGRTTVLVGHALTETVLVDALAVAGIIRSFHDVILRRDKTEEENLHPQTL